MYVAVASTLQAAPDSLGVASLPAKLPQFLAKVAQIYELAALQTQTTRGKTARRDELSQEMIDLALDVAGAVAAHADEHKLTELACSVEVTAGTFKRMRIPHRPILAQQIHDIAQSVVADLAPNGVTAATLVKLQEHIALVKTWLDQPRSVIRAKSAAPAQLAEVFRDADALLKRQIDRLVFLARKTHPEFYADYQRARQVPDYPGPRATQAGPGPAALPALAATSTATSATPAPEVPPDAHVASPESGQSSMTFDVTESEPACRRCVAQASRLPVRKQAGRLRYSKPSPASRLLPKTELRRPRGRRRVSRRGSDFCAFCVFLRPNISEPGQRVRRPTASRKGRRLLRRATQHPLVPEAIDEAAPIAAPPRPFAGRRSLRIPRPPGTKSPASD